jgi:hypothetical protein
MLLVFIVNQIFLDQVIGWLRFLLMISLSFSVYVNLKSEVQLLAHFRHIVIALSVSSIFGIIQFYNIGIYNLIVSQFSFLYVPSILSDRIYGLSSSPINFSYELLVGFFISLFFLLKQKNILNLMFFLLIFFALYLNQTRSALLSILIVYLLYIIKNLRVNNLYIFIIFGTFISVLFFSSTSIFGIQSRFLLDDLSSSARIPMFLTALRYSILNPFGTGQYNLIGTNIDLSIFDSEVAFLIFNNYTHNQFTNFLVEFGYIGLGLLLSIYVLFIKFYTLSINKSIVFNFIYFSIISYSINAMAHNGGIMHAEPLVWIIFAFYFKYQDLKIKNIL